MIENQSNAIKMPRDRWVQIMKILCLSDYKPKRLIWYQFERYEIEHIGIAPEESCWAGAWAYVKSFDDEESAAVVKQLRLLLAEQDIVQRMGEELADLTQWLGGLENRTSIDELIALLERGPVGFSLNYTSRTVTIQLKDTEAA